jgi:tol-pal system protein YbgF
MPRAIGLRLARIVPVGALAALAGCFATRSDVRVIQTDVASLRMEMVRNDAQIRTDLQATAEMLRAATDSVMRLSARTVSIQGDVRGESRIIREQLLQIQSLLGQSAATINRLRAEMERTGGAPPAAAVPPAGGAMMPPDSAAPAASTTGPAQLYQNGRDQLNRNSASTARMLFQELLLKYPTSDLAPEAQYYIAESFTREKNTTAADAAYAAVVTNYPGSQFAATSLFKRAGLAETRNDRVEARRLYNEVIAKYPRSDAATLAAEKLKAIP